MWLNNIRYETPEELCIRKEFVSRLYSFLTPREERIFIGRFIDNDTLKDIATNENIGIERVRQICAKCLRKIRMKLLENRFNFGYEKIVNYNFKEYLISLLENMT